MAQPQPFVVLAHQASVALIAHTADPWAQEVTARELRVLNLGPGLAVVRAMTLEFRGAADEDDEPDHDVGTASCSFPVAAGESVVVLANTVPDGFYTGLAHRERPDRGTMAQRLQRLGTSPSSIRLSVATPTGTAPLSWSFAVEIHGNQAHFKGPVLR